MAWKDIELVVDDEGERPQRSVFTTQPLFQYFNSSTLDAMDHDRIVDGLDFGDDKEDYEMARRQGLKDSRPVEPSTRPHSTINNTTVSAKLTDDDFVLFPSYEQPQDPRLERLTIINNPASSSSSHQLDIAMFQDTVDDTFLQHPPTRHVDYFTHEWNEADISASWRKIVAERQGPNVLQPRLENASWRMWAKTRSKLNTLPAASINW